MKNNTIRSISFALGIFLLWANFVSLLLPAEQYAAIIKIVDFTTVLSLSAILITAFAAAGGKGKSGGRKKGPAGIRRIS